MFWQISWHMIRLSFLTKYQNYWANVVHYFNTYRQNCKTCFMVFGKTWQRPVQAARSMYAVYSKWRYLPAMCIVHWVNKFACHTIYNVKLLCMQDLVKICTQFKLHCGHFSKHHTSEIHKNNIIYNTIQYNSIVFGINNKLS